IWRVTDWTLSRPIEAAVSVPRQPIHRSALRAALCRTAAALVAVRLNSVRNFSAIGACGLGSAGKIDKIGEDIERLVALWIDGWLFGVVAGRSADRICVRVWSSGFRINFCRNAILLCFF